MKTISSSGNGMLERPFQPSHTCDIQIHTACNELYTMVRVERWHVDTANKVQLIHLCLKPFFHQYGAYAPLEHKFWFWMYRDLKSNGIIIENNFWKKKKNRRLNDWYWIFSVHWSTYIPAISSYVMYPTCTTRSNLSSWMVNGEKNDYKKSNQRYLKRVTYYHVCCGSIFMPIHGSKNTNAIQLKCCKSQKDGKWIQKSINTQSAGWKYSCFVLLMLFATIRVKKLISPKKRVSKNDLHFVFAFIFLLKFVQYPNAFHFMSLNFQSSRMWTFYCAPVSLLQQIYTVICWEKKAHVHIPNGCFVVWGGAKINMYVMHSLQKHQFKTLFLRFTEP